VSISSSAIFSSGFPFFQESLASPSSINKMYKFCFTEECPGINQGKILDKKYFNDLFELAKIRFNEKSNKILVWQLNSK